MLAQLVSDGVAAADLEPHFAGFPPSAFEKVVTPGPRAITPRLLKPVAPAPVRAPALPATPTAAEEGISFHYVP